MTSVEIAAWTFAFLNLSRILGYLPQFVAILRDQNGARAVSLAAFTLWMASHLSTAVYIHMTTGDRLVVGTMLINALCCLTIVVLTLRQRWAFRASGRAPLVQAATRAA